MSRPIQTFFRSVNGTRTACRVTGDGPALLLVHGAGGDHSIFDDFSQYLSRAMTVVTYAQRDCGPTENPESESDLQDLADDAACLAEVLGFQKINVFGTSFGGRVAQVLALTHPHRVETLILNSTWDIRNSLHEVNPAGRAILDGLRKGLPATAHELAAMYANENFLRGNRYLVEAFTEAAVANQRNLRRARTTQSRFAGDISGVRCPTLVIAGELDRIVPAQVTLELASAIAGAQGLVLEKVGHVAQLEAPEVLAEHVIAFVEDRGRSG